MFNHDAISSSLKDLGFNLIGSPQTGLYFNPVNGITSYWSTYSMRKRNTRCYVFCKGTLREEAFTENEITEKYFKLRSEL